MKTRLTLKPGQNGTKKLLQLYGAKLVAVRYRYDADRRLRFKTVELVVEQLPWIPPLPASRSPAELVYLHIAYHEAELRTAVRQAGGKWHPERKLWQLRLGTVYELGLDQRIARTDCSRGRAYDFSMPHPHPYISTQAQSANLHSHADASIYRRHSYGDV